MKATTTKSKPIAIRYGRLDPVEWIVVRFHVRDYRVAILEVFHKAHCGKLSRREAEDVQRRIIEAVREAKR